jgi:DNA-binding transcriptional regulator YiaG
MLIRLSVSRLPINSASRTVGSESQTLGKDRVGMRLASQVRAACLPPPDERRKIRVAAGVSFAEVGAELGVSATAVMRWERGTSTPRRDRAVAYRRLLDELQKATA